MVGGGWDWWLVAGLVWVQKKKPFLVAAGKDFYTRYKLRVKSLLMATSGWGAAAHTAHSVQGCQLLVVS